MGHKSNGMVSAVVGVTAVAVVGVAAGLATFTARADIFGTSSEVTPTAAYPISKSDAEFCRHGAVTAPLPLFEAIERSLCESPKTRSAWASVKAAAAGVGAAKAAYLPTLDLSADYAREHDKTTVDGPPDLATNYSQNTNVETLTLGWVLYDFGGRSAALKNSRQLLIAAQANQNVVLQSAFATTASHYYAAQAAAAAVDAERRIETGAHRNLDAASARYKTGIAPITDQLQANTAYAQAVYQRASAEGAYRAAVGQLDIDMNLPPDTPLTMPGLDQGTLPDSGFVSAVHDLLAEAVDTHPSVLAAKAQWAAAAANADFVRSQGLPKIALAGTYSRAEQPLNPNVGTLEYPSHTRSSTIGVTLTMPLFAGFGQSYKIRQAEDEAAVQEQAVRDAQNTVSLGVWSGVQTLQTDTDNLTNTDTVLQSARAAFEAASQRYQSGVGNILELLTSQSTLAGAEQQRIQAQLDWRAARLQLAASLGNLGMWALK